MGGTIAFGLSVLVAVASAMLTLRPGTFNCDRVPSATVLATLSAFLIALCFRLLAGRRQAVIYAALALAAVSLFTDARFVVHYRGICHALQQQLSR